MNLNPNAIGAADVTVTQELTAAAVGSGLLPVYATPSMVALMEQAACVALAPLYEEGETSVGVSIHVEHLAASPVGAQIHAQARVLEMTARKATFDIQVTAGETLIGTAKHTRVAVNAEKFMGRL